MKCVLMAGNAVIRSSTDCLAVFSLLAGTTSELTLQELLLQTYVQPLQLRHVRHLELSLR